jgi:hypothetical protein
MKLFRQVKSSLHYGAAGLSGSCDRRSCRAEAGRGGLEHLRRQARERARRPAARDAATRPARVLPDRREVKPVLGRDERVRGERAAAEKRQEKRCRGPVALQDGVHAAGYRKTAACRFRGPRA